MAPWAHRPLPRAGRRQPRGGRVAPRAGPSHGLRGQDPTQPAVHFYAAAPVHFYAAVDRWVRDWLTSPEYNEATGLRRRYIEDGGGPVESKAKISVGEAIYMVGVFAIDALLTLGVAALIFYAVVS